MLWHEQSWPAIQRLDKDIPVVIPLGSCEQHGHHLPLFVDSMQVTAIAERVERAMADRILLLPTLWLGSSHHHLDFPGTVSVPPSLYSQIIRSMAKCVLSAAFRRVFFLNGHGGNQVPVAQALSELVTEDDAADDAFLAAASWWQVGQEALEPKRHGLTTPRITHACEYETSLMLALRPDLVRPEAARDAPPALASDWSHSEYSGRVGVYRRFHRVTAAGSMGRPTAATAAKGASMLDAITADTVTFLDEFRQWSELPPVGPTGPGNGT